MSKAKKVKPQRFGYHLLLAVGLTILLGILAIVFLNIYTRHGQEVEMPDFIGQDAEELVQNIQSNDFIIVITDYIFDPLKKEGIVLKQNPQPKEFVKKGRKVYLTVASSDPPKVKMPALKDVSLRQAEIMLKAVGLQLGNVIYKPSPFENAVLEQLYKGRVIGEGAEISYGEPVTLVVGKSLDELSTGSSSLPNETENPE